MRAANSPLAAAPAGIRSRVRSQRSSMGNRQPRGAPARKFGASGATSTGSSGAELEPQRPVESDATPMAAMAAMPMAMEGDNARRVREAERILQEVANEYAAKRAAGLVPSRPVPARTLLWEEMAQQQLRPKTGRRGQCVFGRDDDEVCGCSTYSKMRGMGENPGGICDCCGHGGPWHRLTGGSMWASTSSDRLRSVTASVMGSGRGAPRRSRMGSSARSRPANDAYLSGSARSRPASDAYADDYAGYEDYEDYDDEDYYDSDYDDEDDDEDDEDIANEMAVPYSTYDNRPPLMMRPLGVPSYAVLSPTAQRRSRSESGGSVDRSSIVSNGSNLGLPPRLSSTSKHLDRLLGAIARYRAMGLDEDEIEARIRQDFPPTERMSSAQLSPRFAPQ